MRRSPTLYVVPLVFIAFIAMACAPTPPPDQAIEAGQLSDETISLPETSGSAILSYLQSVDYQEQWHLWPGKGEKYEGNQPHGMLLTTYINQPAFDAINGKEGSMPNESIIVKENYMPDGVLDATTVMYKVDGYDPENNDWFWTKILADGTIAAEGRVQTCQACHGAKRDNDFVYTGDLR